jgi:hypothetical protein
LAWSLGIALLLCALAAALLGLSAYGARRWAEAVQQLTQQLDAAKIEPAKVSRPACYDVRELEGLPPPVQRYFRAVLKDGQPLIAVATVKMTGRINLSSTGLQWRRFTSRQQIITRRPGFLWDARVALLPGLAVRVVDGYIAGQGCLRAAVLGLFNVAKLRGAGEIAQGELMRFFAEAAWYPTALLPSQGVRWAPVDERSANATLVDGPLRLTLLFRFSDEGLISSAHAAARAATVGGKTIMLPWEGSWSDYQARDGMRVPMTGEATWLRPEGRRTYFHGDVAWLRFRFLR